MGGYIRCTWVRRPRRDWHATSPTADTFIARYRALLVCAWGERGAWALDKAESGGGKLSHSDAVSPERVVDTLAAGDTFNGAFITALCKHRLGVPSALRFACAVAGAKVGQMGLRLHEDDIDAALKLVTSTEM